MTLTEYLRNPRVLTREELNDIDREVEAIDTRVSELVDGDILIEHYGGRLDALELILETSEKLARRRERDERARAS